MLQKSRRYAGAELKPLPQDTAIEQDIPLMTLTAEDGLRHEYILQSQLMPDAGWTVRVLLDTASLRAQARIVLAATLLLMCAAGFAAVLVMQRRRSRAELERRVEERTADLARVNRRIETEIAERRHATMLTAPRS